MSDMHTNLIVVLADGTHRTTTWYRDDVTHAELRDAYRMATSAQAAHRVHLFLGLEHHRFTGSALTEFLREGMAMRDAGQWW
jgi:hypothetical protein